MRRGDLFAGEVRLYDAAQGPDARWGEAVGPLQVFVQANGAPALAPFAGAVLNVGLDILWEVGEEDRLAGVRKASEEFGDEPVFVKGGFVRIGDPDGFPFELNDAFPLEAAKGAAPFAPVELGVRLEFFEGGRRPFCGTGDEGGFGGCAFFYAVNAPFGERYGRDGLFGTDLQEAFGEQPFDGPPELAGTKARRFQEGGIGTVGVLPVPVGAEGADFEGVERRQVDSGVLLQRGISG